MKIGRGVKKSTLKIVAATTVTIFTLFVTVFGAFAWFSATLTSKIDNDEYEVVRISSGGGVESINLIKFEYPINSATHKYDFSRGQDGVVKKYTLIDGVFTDEDDNTTTSVLTTYDPAEKIVYGNSYSLFNSNCQAFYEITLKSEEVGNFLLKPSAVLKKNATKENERDIFLSDCVDFSIFTVTDIGNDFPINTDTGKPNFYPTYIDYHSDNPRNDMNDLENLYYRLSYKACTMEQDYLAHFYPTDSESSKDDKVSIGDNIPVTFAQNSSTCTVYVGVNYAPSELEQYYKEIYLSDINAIYDYVLSFDLVEVVNS